MTMKNERKKLTTKIFVKCSFPDNLQLLSFHVSTSKPVDNTRLGSPKNVLFAGGLYVEETVHLYFS